MPTSHARQRARRRIICWYDANARDLPWRRPGTSAWAILVSEFMLQQTPASRALGTYEAWLERWPTPQALARASTGDAVRMWGRLGYPRRALRLHAAAVAITDDFSGCVPDDPEILRRLPGIGEYTAAAIATFAYGGRHMVADVNIRRLIARMDGSVEMPATHLTTAERERLSAWVPVRGPAARWAAAAMELGAVICTATRPHCDLCPVAYACLWRAAGYPPGATPKRTQPWQGTDRQCRGRLLARLRENDATRAELTDLWHDPERAGALLDALVTEGLAHRVADRYTLEPQASRGIPS